MNISINELAIRLDDAIYKAENNISNISVEDISLLDNIQGMTDFRVQTLLNHLINYNDVNYLEIGVYNGKSFFGAISNAKFNTATAVDNFSEIFSNMGWYPHEEFYKNYETFVLKKNIKNVKFINQDCFAIDLNYHFDYIRNPINVYFYDGAHSEQDQYKALEYYLSILDYNFIYIVDDWSDPTVARGTYNAISDLNLRTYSENILPYWRDINTFVLQK